MNRKRALISVTDKTDLVELARTLAYAGYEIVSTGGTAEAIRNAGLAVTDVASVTGFPEMLDGRVKTLHPLILGGILAVPEEKGHQDDMAEHGIKPFDLVVVNLYDFAGKPGIEQIDVGGPTMIRAAAKNHAYVGVVTDPNDYGVVIREIEVEGELSPGTSQRFAAKAFAHTANYDLMIAKWMSDGEYAGFVGQRSKQLKYGENAWQTPAFVYSDLRGSTDSLRLSEFQSVEGGEPSLVGAMDQSRALQVLTHLAAAHSLNSGRVPFMAIGVKHGNACGLAAGGNPVQVIRKMVDGDPLAIFGGVVMTNFPITGEVARELKRQTDGSPRMYDAVIGVSFDDDAVEVLHRKGAKCRMLFNPALGELGYTSLDDTELWRTIRGGDFLVQPNYTHVLDLLVSEKYGAPLDMQQQEDLLLAWAAGAMANSNSMALAWDGQLLALGAGQQSRIGGLELAIHKAHRAGHKLKGAVLYSDSFNPFDDVARMAGENGISAIFASSGSLRDADTIAMCEQYGISLLMQPDADVRGFAAH